MKLDNMLFSNAMLSLDKSLEEYLAAHPAEQDSETGLPKSQPLPNDWTYETSAHEAE
ncbi:hypothetical protein H1R20_g2615, partial [Candolleomyces eurysporus]